MSAVGASENDLVCPPEAKSARIVRAVGGWLPAMTVATGALLSAVWTASLLGLAVWALSLIV